MEIEEDYLIKKSPYEILGLVGDFEFKDIKKAYRRAIRENPPEKNPKEFAQISDAYHSLTNEDYILNNLDSVIYYLDVNLKMDREKSIDKNIYLKKIFEVPFKI